MEKDMVHWARERCLLGWMFLRGVDDSPPARPLTIMSNSEIRVLKFEMRISS